MTTPPTPHPEQALPPLPKPDHTTAVLFGCDRMWFSADQMREYALAALTPQAPAEQWRAMLYAPLDGSKVELLIRHGTWWTAHKHDPRNADESWEQIVVGQWLDFNGGGWSWDGLAGEPIGWRPIAAPAEQPEAHLDVEALIRACVPGGDSCGPQHVADELRRYLNAWPQPEAATVSESETVGAAAPAPVQSVAWMRNLSDPQPHAVTDLRYRSVTDVEAGVEYVPVYATPPGESVERDAALPIPPEIAAIAERLHTQDNRITQDPLFAVQQKRRIYGMDAGYCDNAEWLVDGETWAPENDEVPPDGACRVGFIDKWEFVTGCLTEQGCKDFIACNGHNLHEPRIYAYGSYRNAEWIALRKWLMSLRPAAADREKQP